MTEQVDSGIQAVGPVRWGTHFCQFFETAEDLADVLVPYFKAGIDNDEQCMWVTAAPLRAPDAADALRNAVPDLDARIRRGQVDILDHETWYRRADKMGADEVIAGWLRRKDEALARGRRGFRLTGNTYFLEAEDWDSFAEYEAKVSACFCDHRLIALCSYCTSRCDAGAAMDVVQNHEFALARRRGAWVMIESSSVKQAKEALHKANEALEQRVAERTSALSAALAEKEVLLREVHHRVKNNLQVVANLLGLKARASAAPEMREAFGDTLRRIKAMGLVHEALYRQDDTGAVDFGAYLLALGRATAESFGAAERVAVEVEAAFGTAGRLDLNAAVPLGLIASEALANACKHAFPDDRTGRILIAFRAPEGEEEGKLVVADDGIGMAEPVGDGGRRGRDSAGLTLVEAIARQVRGRISIRPGRGGRGTELRLAFRGP
jgi:two-component sensor histidine kinase